MWIMKEGITLLPLGAQNEITYNKYAIYFALSGFEERKRK
jgi:hypothetical protein